MLPLQCRDNLPRLWLSSGFRPYSLQKVRPSQASFYCSAIFELLASVVSGVRPFTTVRVD